MKRFSKIFGAVLLVLLIAAPAWPASLTLTNERVSTIGNLRLITGTATTNSGDTYAVPLGTVVSVQLTPGDAVNQSDIGYSISGTTITIYVGTDNGTVDFYIVGF